MYINVYNANSISLLGTNISVSTGYYYLVFVKQGESVTLHKYSVSYDASNNANISEASTQSISGASTVSEIVISGNFSIYSLRLYGMALTQEAYIHNRNEDVSRYESNPLNSNKLSNKSDYYTTAIVAYLDAYYYSSIVNQDGELRVELPDTSSAFVSGVNYANSYYSWVSGYSVTNDVWDTSLLGTAVEGNIVGLAYPEETGKYYLWLQLIDEAGNISIYKYQKEFVIDRTSPKLVEARIIGENSCSLKDDRYCCKLFKRCYLNSTRFNSFS